MEVQGSTTTAEGAEFREALARLKGQQLPHADCTAHRSLEALRLEDPAAMSGCWNSGCACCMAQHIVTEDPRRLLALAGLLFVGHAETLFLGLSMTMSKSLNAARHSV